MTRVILHADMDAFYAAIEQRDRPELRGQAVVVGGLGPRGVVSTASYEARRSGVHSALPMSQARRLCPTAVFLPPRMSVYMDVSEQIQELFHGFTDLVEPLSLDEAFLDVTGSTRLFGDGKAIATQLRARVAEVTGLTVSVGVASCKYVAKVASDLHKPDGLTLVEPGSEVAFLAPLPLSRLWGAGRATLARMSALGLATLADVQARSLAQLVADFGEAAGRHFHALCRGHDERAVVPQRAARSVSRETTFGTDESRDDRLRDVLLELSEDVGRRLRRAGVQGATLRLKLRHPPFETLHRQVRLPQPSDDGLGIYHAALALLEAARAPGRPVRLLGVGLSDLGPRAPRAVQLQLFGEAAARVDNDRVNRTLDAIRERFGADAANRAGARDAPPAKA